MSQAQSCCPQIQRKSPAAPASAASRTAVDGLLRDLAFVYHATQLVKKALTGESALPRRRAMACAV
jgi:hypothetical protein